QGVDRWRRTEKHRRLGRAGRRAPGGAEGHETRKLNCRDLGLIVTGLQWLPAALLALLMAGSIAGAAEPTPSWVELAANGGLSVRAVVAGRPRPTVSRGGLGVPIAP